MNENEVTGKKSSFRLKDADGKVVDNSGNSGFGSAAAGRDNYNTGGTDNYYTGSTDNYNIGGSADNYNIGGTDNYKTGGGADSYNISGGTYNDNTNGEQSYHTTGYAGCTNGGVRPPSPVAGDIAEPTKTRGKKPITLIVMVVLSNLAFLWIAFLAGKQSGFVKKHQDEYTQCQGEASNVTAERQTRQTTRRVNGKKRIVTEEYYLFTFDMTFTYQEKAYTRQCRLQRDNKDSIKNGDTMSFVIRDGAVSRSFSEEYDWLWGTVESNIANSKNGTIFIIAFLIFFDFMFGFAIVYKR